VIGGKRIVITGVGLTSPIGNSLKEHRESILSGKSGIKSYNIRYVGDTVAGICDFNALKYQKRKDIRRGTRAGSIGVYCAQEALADAGINLDNIDKSRVGVIVGVTEHGNVETENEVYNLSGYDYDVKYWSHHHNPRTVANNPAGEITINTGITGLHYTMGAACAAGNVGTIQGAQQLALGEIDIALAGGVSESIHTFGIFAAFKSQGALAEHENPAKASRPFDIDRNGIVISEGGCIFVMERLSDALKRNATIYGELVGYAINSDAADFVLPNADRQAECMRKALNMASLHPNDIDIVSTHATATKAGDVVECQAVRRVFDNCTNTYINNTKSMIGHAMGAAGVLELAGNLPAFQDNMVHATINVDNLDPECALNNLVTGSPVKKDEVKLILNNSFGMLGINSCVIIKKI
jgi:3-oxoacyl-[acyl-carrier-protein] synthase II